MYVRTVLTITLALALCSGMARGASELTGTWCLENEDLSISFYGNDSVRVQSLSGDGVNGAGRFKKQDTIFIATIVADSLEVRMGYRYTWKSDSLLEARALFLTIQGDSVTVPGDTVIMKRCTAPDAQAAKPTPRN